MTQTGVPLPHWAVMATIRPVHMLVERLGLFTWWPPITIVKPNIIIKLHAYMPIIKKNIIIKLIKSHIIYEYNALGS